MPKNQTRAATAAEVSKVDEAVRSEWQRFNNMLETLPAYLVLLTPDHHVALANRFFRERFGESHGQRCFEYLFHRAEPCEVCETYKVLETNAPQRWEWAGPDGHVYDIYDYPFTDIDGAPLIMEMGIDITERKRAEEALQQVNETLEQRVVERTAALQTANEQLQVQSEELRVTNEELQAQSEELRAANEELQAQQEELQAQTEELRASEESLRESEQRYRSLFDNMLDGYAYCQMLFDNRGRPADFVYLSVNDAFTKLTGLKSVVGKRATEVIPTIRASHPELLETYGRVARTGRPERFEIEFKPLRMWLSVSVYSPRKDYFTAVFDDITERKQAEKARAELAMIVEFSDDAIISKDLDGIIQTWNAGAQRLLGYRAEEIVGQPISCLLPPERSQEEDEILRRLRRGEYVEHFETVRVAKDGRRVEVSATISPLRTADGKLSGASKILRDITQRKRAEAALRQANERLQQQAEELQTQAEELRMQTEELTTANKGLRTSEEALRQSEERFRTLANAIPQLAWIARADGYIYWYNQRWYEYTGTTPAQMEGWGWQSVHDPQELPRVLERWKSSIATGAPFDMIFPLRGADGIFRPFLTRVMPLKDEQGQVRQWFGTNTDVSEQKRMEEILQELNATLENKVAQRTAELEHRARQLQKLTLEVSQTEDRERQRMAEVLHDDLQQIIAGAKFHLSLLRNRVQYNASVQTIGTRIDEMLKEAIDKSRSLSHELSPAVLHHDDLAETLGWLASQVRAKHGLEVHMQAQGPVIVQSDALKGFLYKAAQELLFNVVKHARVNEAGIRVRRHGSYICLSISDRGRGFDPRGLRQASGFGLLSIRERIELLGGHMKIRSAPGKGSTFLIVVSDGEQVVALPRSGAEAVPPEAAGRGAQDHLRVLLADDHRIVREGLRELLREEYDIEIVGEAMHGRQAVDLALRLKPDVVIMDVSMPLIDGDEATRQIKGHLPKTRVVALSTYSEPQVVQKMYRAGAESYVLKTASAGELLAAVRGGGADS